jgi:hypothetical protein
LIFTYASFRSQPPSDKFTVQAIAGTAANLQRNFYIQYANRSGRSLLSDAQTVTSSGVRITLQPNLILSGEEVFWIIISYETSGDPEDAKIISMWQARGNDQVVSRSLPVALNFITEDSLRINRTVLNDSQLPDVFSVPNGAIALVADTGIYYRSDREAYVSNNELFSYGTYAKGLSSRWIEWNGGFNAYIASTDDLFGADASLHLAENSLEVPPKIADVDSTPTRYWLNNGLSADGGSPKVDGRYSLTVKVNGIKGYEGFFANRIKYSLVGYVDRATGILDQTIADVGQIQYWNPSEGAIVLPEDLPRNHAAVYDLILSFDNADAVSVIGDRNPEISIDFLELLSIQGNLSQAANLIGDLVYKDGEKLLVVPGVFRLSGIASVKIKNSSQGYYIDAKGTQFLADVLPDTSNQIVAMSGALNGHCLIRQSGEQLGYGEVLRAIISTAPGISKLFITNSLTLTNQGFKVRVEHPISSGLAGQIRADYPDSLIAGNIKGLFTPTTCYIYLSLNGNIYRSNPETVTAVPVQEFSYNSLASFTQISALPTTPDLSFCLFEPSDVSISAINGTFTGNAVVGFAYAYESPNYKVTSINNEPLGVIPTAKYTLAEAINYSLAKTENLNDLADKAIARNNLDVYSKSVVDTHVNNTSNPHQVTTSQIGAATTAQLATTNNNVTANTNAIALNTASRNSLGTAATRNVGTAINNVIALQDVGGTAKLPAVDGSQLTGIGGQLTVEFVSGTFAALVSATSPINYLIDTSTAVATANLPATPPDKGIVAFSDRRKTFGTMSATIVPGSGHTIDGQANFLLDFDNEAVTLIFDSANNNYSVLEGIQNTSVGSGDMSKSVYDTNNNGVVDKASAIDGITTAGNNKIYGTNGSGVPGFYDYLVGSAIKTALASLTGSNRLGAGAIAGMYDISNSPGDGYAPIYDLASGLIQWQYVNRGIGAGAILIPSSQSLFTAADNTLITAYVPDVGSYSYSDIKILTTASTPVNKIIANRLQIDVINTGVVLDLGVSNTVLRSNWTFITGTVDALIARYSSNGNMVILRLTGTAIAIETVVNDVFTVISSASFAFTNNTSYKIEMQVIGVAYKVLIDDTVVIAEALTSQFISATKFGVGKIS